MVELQFETPRRGKHPLGDIPAAVADAHRYEHESKKRSRFSSFSDAERETMIQAFRLYETTRAARAEARGSNSLELKAVERCRAFLNELS